MNPSRLFPYVVTRSVALLCLCALCSCAVQVPSRLSQALPSAELLLQTLDMQATRFSSLRGLAKASFSRNDEKRSARQVVLAEYPDKLRLETLGLFGAPALLVASDGDAVTALLPAESRAYTGPAESSLLQRLTQLPLADSDIVAILLQRPQMIAWRQQRVEQLPQGRTALVLSAGKREQRFEFDEALRPVGVVDRFDGQVVSSVRYRELDQAGLAHVFQLQIPLLKTEATLHFSEVEANVEHRPGLFSLKPPDGYRVEPLPDY